MKNTIHTRREDAAFKAIANATNRSDMLTWFLSSCSHKRVKEFCEEFDVKVKS